MSMPSEGNLLATSPYIRDERRYNLKNGSPTVWLFRNFNSQTFGNRQLNFSFVQPIISLYNNWLDETKIQMSDSQWLKKKSLYHPLQIISREYTDYPYVPP